MSKISQKKKTSNVVHSNVNLTLEKNLETTRPMIPKETEPTERTRRNLSNPERMVSGVMGGSMLFYGASHLLSIPGQLSGLTGAFLLVRGVTGHCPIYQAFDINTTAYGRMHHMGIMDPHPLQLKESTTTWRSPLEVYEFCRDPAQMLRFFPMVKNIEKTDASHSIWTFGDRFGMADIPVNVEITQENAPHSLSWMAFPESKLRISGHLHFTPGPQGEGTEIVSSFHIIPPAGMIGATLMRWMSPFTSRALSDILHKMKQLLETGEITTSENKAHPGMTGTDQGWSNRLKNHLQVRTLKTLAHRSPT